MRKPQRSNSKDILRWKNDVRKIRRTNEREPWPKNIRDRAVRLMISGAVAAELAEGSGVPEHTLHTWRQHSQDKGNLRSRRRRAGRPHKWREIQVVDGKRAERPPVGGLRVILAGGAEIVGSTTA